MGRINPQSLIDEVLGMIKQSQNIRKKKNSDDEISRINQSWDDTPAGQAYWKDMRGRNTQLEIGKMQNAGQMDVARENNAGQLARQQLSNTGDENVANIQSRAHIAGIESATGATKYAADQGVKAAGLKEGTNPIHAVITEAIKADPLIATDPVRFNQLLTNANKLNMKPPTGEDKSSFIKPDAPLPIPSGAGVTTRPRSIAPAPSSSSVMDIDSQITDEANKEKLFKNKYANWAAKRARNILGAAPRAIAAGAYKGSRALDDISKWEGWDR